MSNHRLTLILSDTLLITLSFLLSFFLRQSTFFTTNFSFINYNPLSYTISFIVASILLLAIFGAFKLYQIREIEFSARIFTVLKALATWTFVLATLIYITKLDFSRGVFFITIILTTTFIVVCRYLLFRRRQKNISTNNPEIIILGTGDRSNHIESNIKSNFPNASIIKLDINESKNHEYLINHSPTEIFVADEHLSRDLVLSIIADDRFGHHSFRVILDVFKLVTGEILLNDIDEIPSIVPKRKPHTIYNLGKRVFDIIISLIGIILSSPIWLFIMLTIKLDTKGSILIHQIRAGYNGKPFTMLKFRTMHHSVALYEISPNTESDPRITKVGKVLRRLSLDELPQLWNILKGDMSLVGPRPEMEFIVQSYAPWQRLRLNAKPGLTGLWQILGRKDIPLHKNLEYDFYYICNRDLLLDITIILKTIPAVLFGRGAY